MGQSKPSAENPRQSGAREPGASGRKRPSIARSSGRLVGVVLAPALLLGCSAASADPGPEPEMPVPVGDTLNGCKGKASSSIPASGLYVLTTFGGAGESQPLACGGSSKKGSWYYAASRQRYGCGSRIRVSANGSCVVAQTDDYGPDVCVEKAVGMPVLDASPLVAKALFGTSSLGWSDKKQVKVEVVDGSTPLGPCDSPPPPPPPPPPSGAGGAGGASPSGGSGGTEPAPSPECSSDGMCNPGNDGSGLICENGQCVPGCHSNAQCPGVTKCKNGQCS
jgi:hypothetical protein